MDNVTHSLIGVLAGYLLRGRPAWTRAALITAIVGNNLPDIDLVMRPFFHDQALGYLVHHRGYTHTLLAAIPQAFLAAWLGQWLGKADSEARPRLLLIAFLSLCLHLLADSWNNYGVHPFWPLNSQWLYGDFIFIVEPLLWMSLLPFAFSVSTPGLRWMWAGLGIAMLLLAWGGSVILPGVAAAISLWALLACLLQRRLKSPWVPLGLSLLLLLTFGLASRRADQLVSAYHRQAAPGEATLEVALSPYPANPLCWQVLLTSTVEMPAPAYIVRTGRLSLLPELLDPSQCAFRDDVSKTVQETPVALQTSQSIHWTGEYRAELSTLETLVTDHCRAEAYMHFARAPYWQPYQGGQVLGDLRYDFEPTLGWSEIFLSSQSTAEECLPWLPAWQSKVATQLLSRVRFSPQR